MRLLWFLALLAVPVVEIWFIVQVAQAIGGWQTALLLILVSGAGMWLIRREGTRTWRALAEAVRVSEGPRGEPPSRELADGGLLLVGGVLLLVPGFLTSIVGLFFVLPVFRPLTRTLVAALARRRGVDLRVRAQRSGPTVVQGEVVTDEPQPPADPRGPRPPGPGSPSDPPALGPQP